MSKKPKAPRGNVVQAGMEFDFKTDTEQLFPTVIVLKDFNLDDALDNVQQRLNGQSASVTHFGEYLLEQGLARLKDVTLH